MCDIFQLAPSLSAANAKGADGRQRQLFSLLIVLWSACMAAQGPAAQATAQRLAPRGGEAEALALPRAAGDAVYIVAPVCLGLVADARIAPGAELALAGAATFLGAAALGALRGEDPAR